MKKQLGFLFTFLFLLSAAEAKPRTFSEITEVISAKDLDISLIEELVLGLHPDAAVEFLEGTSIPIHFFLNNKFFSIAYNPNITVRVNSPCYLRFNGRSVYMSADLIHWEKPGKFCDGLPEVIVKPNEDGSEMFVDVNFSS
jgi:hypothetical protein